MKLAEVKYMNSVARIGKVEALAKAICSHSTEVRWTGLSVKTCSGLQGELVTQVSCAICGEHLRHE
jgi:hypothetical protein